MCKFDYKILERQIISNYKQLDNKVWTAADYIKTIEYFMRAYEKYRKRSHYPLSNENLKIIMHKLPFADNENDNQAELTPSDYKAMINRYFNTKYKNGCDYSIYHFLSDGVRIIKYYECCY